MQLCPGWGLAPWGEAGPCRLKFHRVPRAVVCAKSRGDRLGCRLCAPGAGAQLSQPQPPRLSVGSAACAVRCGARRSTLVRDPESVCPRRLPPRTGRTAFGAGRRGGGVGGTRAVRSASLRVSSRRDAAAPGLTGSTKTAQSSGPHAGPSVFRGRGEEGHTHSRGGVPWQLGGERACGRPGDPSPISGASGSSRPGPALCVCLVTQLQMRAVSTEKGSLDGDAARCSFWGGAGVRCRTLPPLALPQTLGAGVFRRTPQAPGRARGAQGRPGGGGGR